MENIAATKTAALKGQSVWRNSIEGFMKGLFGFCGMVAVVAVVGISLYVIIAGLPAIREIGFFKFIFGTVWKSTAKKNPQFGILPFILTSLYGTAGAIVLGVPIGLLTAIFLSKIATPKLSYVLHSAVELLSGIPSVVYGLIGMTVLVPWIMQVFNISNGTCLLAAIIVLAIMILPSIITMSEDAIRAVPQQYEEASLALGATQMETIFKVSVPAAKSGIAAGIVLGIGRAIGEAMAVLMVAGNVAQMPSLFKSVTFLTTAIAKEMSYAGGLQRRALFSIGLVLFIFIMLINILLNYIMKKGGVGGDDHT